uniref:5'-nucleotidase n=1 Tax=Maylandia zebra TaxID=106582 RepID=A0A3P9AU01_9CICH
FSVISDFSKENSCCLMCSGCLVVWPPSSQRGRINNQLLLISSFFVSKLFIPCFLFQVFGNHEFDNGVEGLMKPFLEQIKCPILSANIKPDHTLNIFTIGREKVGVVGYTTQETPALSKPGPHLQFLDEVTSLQVQIIALGHSGFTVDQMIAKKVRGVDVVIGGHTNTFLYTVWNCLHLVAWAALHHYLGIRKEESP